MGSPRRRQQADQLAPVERHDRVVVLAPPAPHALGPRFRDAVVAEPLLDERDEVQHTARHQVVQHLPLVLHLRAQASGLLQIAGVDRLDGAVHRRPRELLELLL